MNEKTNSGGIRVNREGLRPEATNLPYPTHSVVAVLSSEDSGRMAVQRLRSEGVREEEMDLFVGEECEAWLHNYHHRSGFLGHLRQLAESLGTDKEQSKEYEEALKRGNVVLVVKASREDNVSRIQQALAQEGASRMRYYGVLAIRDLS